MLGQRLREHVAVAGFVLRQTKPAGELFLDAGQRRLDRDAALAAQHLVRHAILLEHGDVFAGAVELRLVAEQLQRALRALVILNADVAAQVAQAIAAVFRDRDHPALVDRIARAGAVAQHLEQPDPHHGVELRPDHQRAVLHQQPFDRLHRHAGAGPWRGVAGRHFAGIGKRGLQRRFGLTVDDRHFVAGTGEVVGRGDTDDTAAEDQNFHAWSNSRGITLAAARKQLATARAIIRPPA